MTKKEFLQIAQRSWVPVSLVGEGKPKWMSNIPDDIVHLVLASGTFIDPKLVQTNGINISDVVGGIDIYRYDRKDEIKGFPINKDHYIVVLDRTTEDALLVHGPYKDLGHRLFQLPNLPPDITIIES